MHKLPYIHVVLQTHLCIHAHLTYAHVAMKYVHTYTECQKMRTDVNR